MSDDSNGWQPVRISPIPHGSKHGNQYWAASVGKIIRVRPRPDWHVVGDSKIKVFEIHPEDFQEIAHAPGDVAPAIMDYQILAD